MFKYFGYFSPHVDFYVIGVMKISKKPSVTSTLVSTMQIIEHMS